MKKLMITIFMGCITACAHTPSSSRVTPAENGREHLGYLQLKTPYANAAWAEGRMGGVKKALDNKHSRTGKSYPCWNALKPFHGRNLPVSLMLADASNQKLQAIVRMGELPQSKLDALGKDGVFSVESPSQRSGYTVWKIEQVYQKGSRAIERPVIGMVDISESMKASAKLRTLLGLKDSNIQFEKLYAFSGPGALSEILLADVARQTPRGSTAIYDNLQALLDKHPGSEFVIITDGRDNKSKIKLDELQRDATEAGSVINVVLTGKKTDSHIAELASRTGGVVMRDLQENGEVIQSVLLVNVR